jgi:lysophospholipase L1-like esterase
MGLLDPPAVSPRTLALAQGRDRPAAMPLAAPSLPSSPPTVTSTKGSGASVATVASGGSGYAVNDLITLAGGTSNFPAVLQVITVNSGAVASASVRIGGAYSSTPTNAVAQASTTGSGTGATFNVTWNGAAMSTVPFGATTAATNSAFRFTGAAPLTNVGSGYYGQAQYVGTACLWEWTSDADQFDIKILGNNVQGMLWVNGNRAIDTALTSDASGNPHIWTVANGSVQVRNYRMMLVNSAFNGIVAATTASFWAPTEARRPLAFGLGDSYTFATGSIQGRQAFVTMCDRLGLEPLPNGIGGTGWTSATTNDPVTRVTNYLGALNRIPDYVFLDLGFNDAGGNMTTVQTKCAATIDAVRAIAPRATIIAFGPATPVGTTGNLDLVKAAIQAACTAEGVTFVDVANWVNSTNKSVYTGGDNVHPTQAGHDYIGGRKAQAVSALIAA